MRGHVPRKQTIKGLDGMGNNKGAGSAHTSNARAGSKGNTSSKGRTFRKAPFGAGKPVRTVGMD